MSRPEKRCRCRATRRLTCRHPWFLDVELDGERQAYCLDDLVGEPIASLDEARVYANEVIAAVQSGRLPDLRRELIRRYVVETLNAEDRRKRPIGTVYFVADGDLVKIGWTLAFDRRLWTLCSDNPRPLTVLTTMPGTRGTEAMLHQEFAHLREVGEWFHLEVELLSFIESVRDRPIVDRAAAQKPPQPVPSRSVTVN